jgi:hypothetical protein
MSFSNIKCPKAFNNKVNQQNEDQCELTCKNELYNCNKTISPSVCDDFCNDKGSNEPDTSSSNAKSQKCAKEHAKDSGLLCSNDIYKCCDGDPICEQSAQICCNPESCESNSAICGHSSNCPGYTFQGNGGTQGSGGTQGYGSTSGCYINQDGICSQVCETDCDNCRDCKNDWVTCYSTSDKCKQSLTNNGNAKKINIDAEKSNGDANGNAKKININANKINNDSEKSNGYLSTQQDSNKNRIGIIISICFLVLIVIIGLIVLFFYYMHKSVPSVKEAYVPESNKYGY